MGRLDALHSGLMMSLAGRASPVRLSDPAARKLFPDTIRKAVRDVAVKLMRPQMRLVLEAGMTYRAWQLAVGGAARCS